MNLFKELVISAPVSNRLQFGFNSNVIISAVDTSVRKQKGLPIKANTYITLSQVDPETRKVLAQNEFNYWNLDHTTDFVIQNFIDQFTSLMALLEAVGKDPVEFEAKILSFIPSGIEIDAFVVTKDGAKTMQDALQNTFYEMVKDLIGPTCPLLKCKLIMNKKGWLEISKVVGWVLPMTSDVELPEITSQEKRARAEGMNASSTSKTVKPDALGSAKAAPSGEKPIAKSAGFNGL